MDSDALWAGMLTVTIIPTCAVSAALHFSQGWLARLGGLWIGAVAGFVIAGMAHEVITLPIAESWASITQRLAPTNLPYYLTLGLVTSPGMLLVFLQERLNERRERS